MEMPSGDRTKAMCPSRVWTVDDDTGGLKLGADLIDIVDFISQMTEIASARISLRCPSYRSLKAWRLILCRSFTSSRAGKKDQGETSLFILDPTHFLQAENVDIERKRFLQVFDADHVCR